MKKVVVSIVLAVLAIIILMTVRSLIPEFTDVTGDNVQSSEEVVVYSSRKEHLIKPLFDLYEQQSGVKISYLTDEAAPLMARLKAEGRNSPADIFMTVDAGNLWQAAEQGLLQAIDSEVLNSNVPAHLRDADNRWFGLSVRARTIVYSTERVKPEALSTYEALGDSQWQGRLCLRTSKKVYNQSLVATMMARLGEEKTAEVIKAWVNNLATPVFSDDTNLMEAIIAGQCDVGIVNTYYFGRLQDETPNIPLKLFWPNQQDRGVHINISGAGVVKNARHPKAAQQLLEWLSSEQAQEKFAGLNKEYPVNPQVTATEQVASWGQYKADDINVEVAGRLQVAAIMLMDRVGYK